MLKGLDNDKGFKKKMKTKLKEFERREDGKEWIINIILLNIN